MPSARRAGARAVPRVVHHAAIVLSIASLVSFHGTASGALPPVGPIAPRAVPPAAPGQLVLRNDAADTLRVEVRAGERIECAANALVGRRSIPPERTWAISVRRPLCWRTGAVTAPGVEPTWSAWQRAQVADDQRLEKTLAP